MRRRWADGGGVGEAGSEEEGEDAHRVRGATLMLNVGLVRQGAHGDGQNSSPELVLATDALGQGRRRCCGPREDKRRTVLSAQDHGKDVCVNGRGRGGLELPEELVGGETDGGAQSFCRRRFAGAPADE